MPLKLHGFSYIGKCRVQWDHILPQLKIIIFFSWNGVQRTLEMQGRVEGRGPAAGHGAAGARAGEMPGRGESAAAPHRGGQAVGKELAVV